MMWFSVPRTGPDTHSRVSFIHSLNSYLLSAYNVSGTIQGNAKISLNKTNSLSFGIHISGEEEEKEA